MPMLNRMKLLAASAAIALLAPVSAHANLIANGSFESPDIGNTWYMEYGTNILQPNYGGPSIPNWTILAGTNVDIVSALGAPGNAPAADGKQYLDLVGTGDSGGISQTFDTTKNQTYTLSFDYGNNPWSTTTASALITVALNGLSANVTHSTSTQSNIDWTLFTMTFLGNGSPMTLSFLNTVGGNSGGVLLDNIVVATPLPAALPLFAGGLAMIGLIGRKRRKSVASVAAA